MAYRRYADGCYPEVRAGLSQGTSLFNRKKVNKDKNKTSCRKRKLAQLVFFSGEEKRSAESKTCGKG